MIFMKKDENNNVTGGYVLRFNLIHFFFIVQVLLLAFGGLFNIPILERFIPLILVAGVISLPIFIIEMIEAVFTAFDVFKGKKVKISKYLKSALVYTQFLSWILALFGIEVMGPFVVFIILFAYDVLIAMLVIATATILYVLSDVLLIIGLEKPAFAIKKFFETISSYIKSAEKDVQ